MDNPPKKTIDNEKDEKTDMVDTADKTETSVNTEKTEDQIREDIKKSALEKAKKTVTVVNVEELAENEARKAADANMAESHGSKKIGFFKKMWKHTFFDEYYRQKEVNKVREDIKNTGNIYTGRLENKDKVAHETTMKAISDRFTSEYEGTLADGEAKKMLDEKDPETIQAKTDIKNLLDSYAMGKIDDEAFNTEKNKIIGGLKKEDLLEGANNYADNLFEIAQNARLAVEHGAKIEELEYDLAIVVGKAKSSLKTEAHFNWVDQGIDKMKKSYVGRFISPAVLSLGVGLAYSISVGASKKLMASKAAAWISLGGSVAISAAFAGMNESQRVALERKQHGIEMAEGGIIEEGDKRREQLEKYQYTMESSNVLAQNLRDLMFEKDKDGNEIVKDIKPEDLQKIMASLSEIDARKSLNTRKKIDLISYTNISSVEKESTDLTILTARAKVELKKRLDGGLKSGLPEGKDFDSYLKEQTQTIEDTLLGGEKGINSHDKAFRRYKAGRIAKKMAQTAVAGLIIGGTIQEVFAFFKDDVQGLAESMFHQDAHATMQTPFESIRGWILGNPSHMEMGNAVHAVFNGHDINIPEGTSLVNNADGTFDLLRGGHVVTSHFLPTFNADGGLDAASVAKLGQDGIIATATHQIIDSTKEVTGNSQEWLLNHPGETIKVDHNAFMDQNTSMTPDQFHPGHLVGADGNEPLTQWGGINGTGVNENGDTVMNISQMIKEGSYHGNISVDVPKELNDGNLMALIFLNSTHGAGIPVPIDASGNIIFDHNNPIMQQIFSPGPDGHMVSHARVIEIVQKMGTDANGVEHVRALSAVVGEGLDKIKDIVPSHLDIAINNLTPTRGTEMPLFVPLVARRPLGKIIYGPDGKPIKPSPEGDKEKKSTIQTEGDKDLNTIPGAPIGGEENKDLNTVAAIPVGVGETIEKQKTMNEMSKEEYDAMYDDLKMINLRIQSAQGIITLEESDLKSAYGKKRYMDLKSIAPGVPVRFNKDELEIMGKEIEGLLSSAKIVEKEKELTVEEKGGIKSDIEMLNKAIQNSQGIIALNESSFQSEYGKKRYRELKSIAEGKGITFNKNELPQIATEMEAVLRGPRKIEQTEVVKAPEETIVEKVVEQAPSEKVEEKVVEQTEVKKAPEQAPAEEVAKNLETEKLYKIEDLSKIGTVFEDKNNSFKVLGVTSFLGMNKKIKIEYTNKITGEKKTDFYPKKDLIKDFNNGVVKIKSVE